MIRIFTLLYSTLLYSTPSFPSLKKPDIIYPVSGSETMSASSARGRDLAPDRALVNSIFPNYTPASITILSQTYEVCTFIAHMDTTRSTGKWPGKVVVRLELPSSLSLRTVSTLQRVAALAIPEAVPAVLHTGTAKADDGREFEFSVSAFVADAVTLETVWDDLTDRQQSNIMDSVVDAMRRLQKLDLAQDSVQDILKEGGILKTTAGEGGVSPSNPNSVALGNREIGFFNDVPGLLRGIIADNGVSKKVTLTLGQNGILIATATDARRIPPKPLRIGPQDLELLQRQAVLCHNDLEPRNLLVRPVRVVRDDGSSAQGYDLAAIIDWEMAGFFPFAYEYYNKDALLGSSNISFSWYALFKDRTAPLFAVGESSFNEPQRAFMEALDRIQPSIGQQPSKGPRLGDVGALFRQRWIQREQLSPSPIAGFGWGRRRDASGVRRYGKKDNESLEQHVLKELGFL